MSPPRLTSRTSRDAPTRGRRALGLIADDLTGACDAGVQFAERSFLTVVLADARAPLTLKADLEVLNTDSRNDTPVRARAKVIQARNRLAGEGRTLVFKKIDSTLRGNLGSEILAAMGRRPLAIVAPAFPAMGRRLLDGRLHVRGAVSPPLYLPALLLRQARIPVVPCDLKVVRKGPRSLATHLETCGAASPVIAVMDAASQKDLSIIAQAAARLDFPSLLVGSAGLGAEVARILRRKHRHARSCVSEHTRAGRGRGVALILMGSTHPASVAQCDYFLQHRNAIVVELARGCRAATRRAISEHRHLVLKLYLDRLNKKLLAELGKEILSEGSFCGVILTGGDTASLVLRALRATGIILERQIVPGIPWGRLLGGPFDSMPVATKAGAFGRKDALVAMVDYLARLEAWKR